MPSFLLLFIVVFGLFSGVIRERSFIHCMLMDSGFCHPMQMGVGTALPSCMLLHKLLERFPPEQVLKFNSTSTSGYEIEEGEETTFVLADYNHPVLTHASIPNLLLTYAMVVSRESESRSGSESVLDFSLDEGDIDITPELLQSFTKWLAAAKVQIVGISGAWGEEFGGLVKRVFDGDKGENSSRMESELLVLASETIYEPDSLRAFTRTLLDILEHSIADAADGNGRHGRARALIAAKKVYFGVGGGVDEFLAVLTEMKGSGKKIWDSDGDVVDGNLIGNSNKRVGGVGGVGGVGRCILQVSPR
jgi:protein-histidine N-methyltransferase